MARVIESIGNTYDEALRKGLEELNLSEDEVNIEVIKEQNKAFFSILEKRTVKLRLTEKNPKNNNSYETSNENNVTKSRPEVVLDEETIKATKIKINSFLDDYFEKLGVDLKASSEYKDGIFFTDIKGESTGLVIGHRGENLEALQTITSAVVNNNNENKIRLVLDSENYREKRANSLKQLALKEAEQVIRRKKSYTFEPRSAFERKAIHTALQNNKRVSTHSIGEEPYRKVVITLN